MVHMASDTRFRNLVDPDAAFETLAGGCLLAGGPSASVGPSSPLFRHAGRRPARKDEGEPKRIELFTASAFSETGIMSGKTPAQSGPKKAGGRS